MGYLGILQVGGEGERRITSGCFAWVETVQPLAFPRLVLGYSASPIPDQARC